MMFTSFRFGAILFCIVIMKEVSGYCTTGSDGLSFDCESSINGHSISFSIKVKSCRDAPKLEVSLQINDLGINFDKEFDTSQDIPIPGFTIGGIGVFLHVQMHSEDDGSLKLKLQLTVKAFIKVASVTVMDETIAKADCNGVMNWWNSQSDGVKAGVGLGGCILLIALCACCCCCYCRNKQQQPAIIMAPGAPAGNTTVVGTSNNMMQMPAPSYYPSNIPCEKQINYPV